MDEATDCGYGEFDRRGDLAQDLRSPNMESHLSFKRFTGMTPTKFRKKGNKPYPQSISERVDKD